MQYDWFMYHLRSTYKNRLDFPFKHCLYRSYKYLMNGESHCISHYWLHCVRASGGWGGGGVEVGHRDYFPYAYTLLEKECNLEPFLSRI